MFCDLLLYSKLFDKDTEVCYTYDNNGNASIFDKDIRNDMNTIFTVGHAFAASWYTFLPSIETAASRGATKALGNFGIGWF